MHCTGDSSFPDLPGGVVAVVIHGVVDVSMVVVVISFNSLVIYAILRYYRRHQGAASANKASVRLVLNLAIIDLLAQLSIVYFLSFEYSCSLFATVGSLQIPCLARVVPFVATSTASMCNMVALAFDRYVAVVHSLRYREIMTSRMTSILIMLIWCFGFTTATALVFWNNWTPGSPCEAYLIMPFYYITIITTSFAILIFSIVLYLHWLVHCEALAARDRCKSISSSRSSSCELTQPHTTHNMNTKSARFLYIILACCFCLCAPIMICVSLRLARYDSRYLDLAYMCALTLYNSMFFVNSFIYAWKNTTVKYAILQVCKRKRRRLSLSFSSNIFVPTIMITESTSISTNDC